MPPAIDYRQTFLRHHVPTELDPPLRQEPGFREEILALDSLRHRLLQTFPDAEADIHRLASRRRFFDTMPDTGSWLYLPVRVRPLPAGDRGMPRDERNQYDNLTDLLCHTANTHRSVLLTARSGAGKSTAMLKAFFDCFIGRDPLLGGYLPCYLRSLRKARTSASAGHEVILDLVAEASRLPSRPSNQQLEQWLTYSPPLLLFVDLNAADNNLRPLLAEAIVRFQERFACKHRWIIAYRSAERDATLHYLQQTAFFGTYDLRHLEYSDALKYLDTLRRVEDELAIELAARHTCVCNRPAASAPINSADLQQLFDRYGNDPDSLISTPLLMHFVSLIGIERSAAAESLAQLYAEVVEHYLDRDYGRLDGRATTPYAEIIRHSGLMDGEGRTKIKVAMARVALAILAGGDTRLHPLEDASVEEVLDDLLARPGECREPDWWPADPWWHDGSYYKWRSHRRARRALREFSFLRRDGGTLGFLHDSFLYYFAALALRCRRMPQLGRSSLNVEPVRSEWCRKAVERMHPAPGSWRQPALFLGGMLAPEELRALLPPLLTAEPKAAWFGVVSQVLRGRRRPANQDDIVLCQVERALASRASEVERYPEALFPHVYNHLSWCEEPPAACHAFADSILRPAMNATGRPWLRAELPMPPLREQVFHCDSQPTCLAVYSRGEFVTGHEDGSVRRWRPDSGQCEVLYRHEVSHFRGGCHCIAVDLRDGAVVSGGGDGTVRRWLPGQEDATVLFTQDHDVYAVVVDGRDGAILWGGGHGTTGSIFRSLPYKDKIDLIYQYSTAVTALALNRRNEAILFGHGGAISCWQPGQDAITLLYRHDHESREVVLDCRNGTVLMGGGRDGSICCRFSYEDETIVLLRHTCRVRAVALGNRDREIFFGGEDGIVFRLLPGQEEATVLYRHEAWVRVLAQDGWDGAVLSVGYDRTVRRWLPGRNEVELYAHTGLIRCVAVDSRDGAVLSGDDEGMVCRWLPGQNEGTCLYQQDGPVSAMALDSRQEMVFSLELRKNWDGCDTVHRWLAGEKVSLSVPPGWRWFSSLALDQRSGELLFAGELNALIAWRPGSDQAGKLLWGTMLSGVIVDSRDGTVFSGTIDGKACCWLPRATPRYDSRMSPYDYTVLYEHDDAILAVAIDEYADNLLSGGKDANLRLFRLGIRDFLMLLTPYSIQSISCSLRHNRIALALGDGRLVLVRVEPSVEALLSYPGHGKNRPPEASTW